MKLEGNTILITGGSNGIGLELAREFRSRGNTVIVTGRDQARLEAAQRQVPGLHVIRSDIGQATNIEALHRDVMARFPDLNVLINNAGVMRKTNLHDQPGSLE